MEQNNITKAVLAIGGIFLTIAIVSVVLEVILTNENFANIDVSATISNETLSSMDNVTNKTLSIISTYPLATCSLTDLYNSTDGTVILGSGNYTYYSSVCKVILQDDSPFIGEDINATYDYTYESNSTLSGVNVTDLKTKFSLFITAVISLFAVGGTILGVLWLLPYIKPLFDKNGGLELAS